MADNTMRKSRKVDIIFCIDGTGSMGPCIYKVKDNAKRFVTEFINKMTTEYNSDVDDLNIKIITFRDYLDDGDCAMVQSEWFEVLAGDKEKYETYLNGIIAEGGGPSSEENGLEALYYAITADWKSKGDDDRQIIVLFTDADTLDLQDSERAGLPNYPTEMVDRDGLISLWLGFLPPFMSQDQLKLKQRNKRLVIFAPAGTQYETIVSNFDRSQFKAVSMDAGLADINFDEIIKIIAASASSR